MHHEQWRQNRRGGRCPRWQHSLDTALVLVFFPKCLAALQHLSYKFSRLLWNLDRQNFHYYCSCGIWSSKGSPCTWFYETELFPANRCYFSFTYCRRSEETQATIYPVGIPLNPSVYWGLDVFGLGDTRDARLPNVNSINRPKKLKIWGKKKDSNGYFTLNH